MTDLVICSYSREGKTMSYSWINTVSQCNNIVIFQNLLEASKDVMADWLDSHHGSEVSEKSIFAALSQYWEEQFHVDMDSLNVSTESFRTRGYKTFFMLNSAEHEILNAYKYKNIKKLSIFQAQISLECYFSCP